MAVGALPPLSPPVAGRRRLALRLGLGGLVLVLGALALRALPGLEEVRQRLGAADPAWIAAVLALEVGSCLAFVLVFRAVFARRAPVRVSYEIGMAVQGTNVLLPAGGASGLALGAWSLRRGGMADDGIARRTVAFFLLTSSVNFVVAVLAGAALALGLSTTDASLPLTAGPALMAALVIVALPRVALLLARAAPPPPGAGRLRRAAGRAAREVAGGIEEARVLLRSGERSILIGAAGYMLLDVAALAAAFAAVGHVPSIGALLLGYVLGQLGAILPLPGGVGGADGGLIAALALYGAPLGTAAAAVIAYRIFQLGLPAILGGIALLRLGSTLEAAPIREAAAPAMCG